MPRTNRIKEPKASRIARRSYVPDAQIANDTFVVVDVANHTEADHRHSMRSQTTRTVRRKTKLEKLYDAKALTLEQYQACLWYHNNFTLGYDTIGITAQYENTGGVSSGQRTFCHGGTLEQIQARLDYAFAREGIDSLALAVLDKVVMQGRPIGRLTLTFRLAVGKLVGQAVKANAI